MPRNTTGGSGHKAHSNTESSASLKNKKMIDSFISDIRSDGKCDGVYVGRVIHKCGDGRWEVFYMDGKIATVRRIIIKGSFSGGKGKAAAFVDVGTIVLLADTGLKGALAQQIIAVFRDPAKITELSKVMELDPRILAKDLTDAEELKKGITDEGGFVFENDEDVDIDAL